MLQRGVDVEHLREDELDEVIHFLSNSMDWMSEELGFDPHGELLCVSFLGDEACCEHEEFINALRALRV
ncbi:MAG: hypothetical protein H6741_21435 [Alphaproteobacteria bacterium]|nr:hypothetical protein [Alphaproteobacteria bacterium]